jgi:hypothetical protein
MRALRKEIAMMHPGENANSVLRFLGFATFVAAVAGAVWLVSESGNSPPGFSNFVIVAALAVVFQGILSGALLIAFAAMGENMIGIRKALETSNALLRSSPGVRPTIAPADGTCDRCGGILDEGASYCKHCGAALVQPVS